jgi:predicted glutamine amidotransferase
MIGHVAGLMLQGVIDQSRHARLGVDTTNGDGVGVGWYGSHTEAPAVFRSIEPAWNDRNLREVASHVRSPLFLAHIKGRTRCARSDLSIQPVSSSASQPTERGRSVRAT